MGQEYLIDTNTVIDYLDNKLTDKANDLIDSINSKISVITRMELLAWSGATTQQTAILEEFINSSSVYPLDEPVILKSIEIRKLNKLKINEMIRTIVIPDKTTFPVTIPEDYIGRNIEIILFAVDEASQGVKKVINRTFDAAKLDLTNYKFDRDEANQR
jgi:predicted nucleic acid-binding protein